MKPDFEYEEIRKLMTSEERMLDRFCNDHGFEYVCKMPKEKAYIYGNSESHIGVTIWENGHFQFDYAIMPTSFRIVSRVEDFSVNQFEKVYEKFWRVIRWYELRGGTNADYFN